MLKVGTKGEDGKMKAIIRLLSNGGYRCMDGVTLPALVEATMGDAFNAAYVTRDELARIGATDIEHDDHLFTVSYTHLTLPTNREV